MYSYSKITTQNNQLYLTKEDDEKETVVFASKIQYYRKYVEGKTVTFPRFICNCYLNGIEIGDFTIESDSINPEDSFTKTSLASMSIYVNNEYQNRGYAREMICNLVNYIEKNYKVRKDKMLFIDADASVGFWDYIGMLPNRYYDRYNLNREGTGYEKVIIWDKLANWAKKKLQNKIHS